MVPPVRKKK
jgi:hypothetical protein